MTQANTITELLQYATSQLGFLGSTARLDAEALLAHVMQCDRSYFRTWPEKQLEPATSKKFCSLLERRINKEPLAYITGWKEFWSLQLQVTPDTLIPRPETEHLVEQALEYIPQNANWQIADLGTGSGAIALAIASERPNCQIIATDISATALEVAQVNAKRLGINNILFKQGDWSTAFEGNQKFAIIVSNPPYVDADDPHLEQDGLPHEPQTALTPGNDGLTAIRSIVKQTAKHLSQPGWLLLEHGYDQGAAVRDILLQHGFNNIETRHDLANQERLTFGQLAS